MGAQLDIQTGPNLKNAQPNAIPFEYGFDIMSQL
jgi:hypothetical protein